VVLTAIIAALLVCQPTSGSTAASTTYTVVAGDTLWGIATTFGFTSWRPVYEANTDRINDPDSLVIGTVLTIPAVSEVGQVPVTSGPVNGCGVSAVTGGAQACGWRDFLYRTAPYPTWEIATVECESGGDPRATNPSSGAAGIAQFMPSTARDFGRAYLGHAVDPYDWVDSLRLMNAMAADGLLAVHWECARG
jgi:hypothetical protein